MKESCKNPAKYTEKGERNKTAARPRPADGRQFWEYQMT